MSGTIGLGNIAGVAVAISIGGPGAMIWMIITAFFGMTLKFVEVSLGHKYRVIHSDGTVSGGAIRYLSDGLGNCGLPKFGKFLLFFLQFVALEVLLEVVICFRLIQAFQQIVEASGGLNSPCTTRVGLGKCFCIIVGLIIFGGIKSIGKVTEKLVPLMALVYVSSCILIIGNNFSLLPETFKLILLVLLALRATTGGVIGSMIAGIKGSFFK